MNIPSTPSNQGRITSGEHISYWIDTMNPIQFTSIDKDYQTDVVIIGGGISGITIAYCLSKIGKKVVVIEDGNIGSGETGHTSAHLTSAIDDKYYELERIFGEKDTRLIAESHRAAIDFIEDVVKKEKISCDFERVNGYLFLHPSDEKDALKKELVAAQKAGLEIRELNTIPGIQKNLGPCLEFKNQAQFHPLHYINGLCNCIRSNGGLIFTQTHVSEISNDFVSTGSGYKVSAKYIVVATNSPINNKYIMHLKQYPHRTYMIGAKIKKDTLPKALWWDTGDHSISAFRAPYHYIRVVKFTNEYDLLLCGGEDHPTGFPEIEHDPYSLLETWARDKFDIDKVIYKWSGQILEPIDAVAYIGRNPLDKENVFIVTGDSGNGLTHGTIAGMLITDLIEGKENNWERIYDPSRFKLRTVGKIFFKELGNIASYMLNKPQHEEIEKMYMLKRGEGLIVDISNKKYGAYRDDNDQLHIVSAECRHLKCIVNWNADEKTWDCPCHGSRYTFEGIVINGPANNNLSYYKDTSEKREMNPMVDCMIKLMESGFKENFVIKGQQLWAPVRKKLYNPKQVKIVNYYRFEGISDPADNAILYAIETNDGIKGSISDAYGPYADDRVSGFINQVEEISKRDPLTE